MVYAYADCAGKKEIRRSVSELAATSVGASVALVCDDVTMKSEYVAVGVKEDLRVGAFNSFIHSKQGGKAVLVQEVNDGAINLAMNPLSSTCSKHVDVHHDFLGER